MATKAIAVAVIAIVFKNNNLFFFIIPSPNDIMPFAKIYIHHFKGAKMKSPVKKIIITEFLNGDEMLNGIETIYRCILGQKVKSNLYFYNNKYRLVFICNMDLPKLPENIFILNNTKLELAKTQEYGKLIVKNNAVNKIGKWLI